MNKVSRRGFIPRRLRYTYNPDGLRASKTVDGVTTKHIWSGSEMVLDITGTDVVKYVRGIGLIASVNSAGTKKYYLYNAHGDVTMLTDTSGAVAKTYDYDAFGVEKNPVATDANPFRYCGEYFDKETDTYYLRARYYNPKLGRFITEDPIGDGLNWYTYCAGNPVLYIDPSGEACYVYYDPNIFGIATGKWYAKAMEAQLKDKYKTDVKFKELSNYEKIKEDWSAMTDVDFVGILAHGNADNIRLFSAYDKDCKEDTDNNTYMSISDIKKLDSSIEIGSVYLASCQTGNEDNGTNNVARAFMSLGGVNAVVAPDGDAYASISWFKNHRNYAEGQGYMLYTKNTNGTIKREVLFGKNKEFNINDLHKALKKQGVVK